MEVTVYRLQKLRCNLCGEIFTAKAPEGVGEEKYDAATGAMIGLLKYGSGMPFNRLQALQDALGLPLAGSTLWEILEDGAGKLLPIFQELIRQGAQGEVLHDDDTVMRVRTLLRRKFVSLAGSFPEETRFVIDKLAEVYKNEEEAKREGMSPEERLAWHQERSAPHMEELKRWMEKVVKEKKVEPNSRLGKAILHRKNSYFYQTENGARVGDLYMSLLYTAQENGLNVYPYLKDLLEHFKEVAADPKPWLPWNWTGKEA